jgi:two-component system, response regulator RegA
MQIVIADEHRADVCSLGSAFAEIGCDVWVADSCDLAIHLATTRPVDLLVSELQIAGHPWTTMRDALRERAPDVRIAIVTAYGSVESAISAIKLGASAYLVKPVTAAQILAELEGPRPRVGDEAARDLTLDCAVYELITRTVDAAGSIAEAARRLNLHGRSLRRMLSRQPRRR